MENYKMRVIGLFFILVFMCHINGFCADAGGVSNNITLDIKGMDILDVLKILSMKSGLNIVAGKNVSGKVTIYLKDVDVWDALQIVLVANNLAYEKEANIINVMTDRDYELIYGEKFYDKKQTEIIKLKYAKAAEVSKVLMQAKTNIGKVIVDEGSNTVILIDAPSAILQMKQMINEIDLPTQTKVFSLKYAKAEDVEKKITELITKNLGIVKVDARSNKIVVTDSARQLEIIENVVSAFDVKDVQVMIEAKILDITLSDEFKMGIDWDVIADKYFRLTQNLKMGLSEGGTIKIGTIAGGGNPQVEGDYSSLIDALHKVGNVDVLSAPRIMALNNQESKILVGTKEAYITSTTSQGGTGTTVTSQSVNFVDTGIKLYVTPTINEDGFVTMKIKPEISSAERVSLKSEDKLTEIPIVSTSETETTIMVKDGTTIVMAGLIKDSQTKTLKKIPVLGDIPFVGKIFSSNSDVKAKREIVILLTPHIVSGESTFAEVGRWQRYEGLLDKVKDRVEKEDEQLKKEQEPVSMPEQTEVSIRTSIQELALKDASALAGGYGNYFLDTKRKIQEQIGKNFLHMKLKGEGTVTFTLDANGNLQDEPMIISEDNKIIGDAIVESVKLSTPFTRFPDSFDSQSEKFTVTVSFE